MLTLSPEQLSRRAAREAGYTHELRDDELIIDPGYIPFDEFKYVSSFRCVCVVSLVADFLVVDIFIKLVAMPSRI